MNLEEFVARFAEEFDETPAEQFKADTVFKSLEEWGSLTALSIIAMVDEEYDVQLKGDDMRAAITVEDLFNIVRSKIA